MSYDSLKATAVAAIAKAGASAAASGAAADASKAAAALALTDLSAAQVAVMAIQPDPVVPPTPVPPVITPDGYVTGTLTDKNLIVWGINPTNGKLTVNGRDNPNTFNVKRLYADHGVAKFVNAAGVWYIPNPDGVSSSQQTTDPTGATPVPPPTTGTFVGLTGTFKSNKRDLFKTLDLTFWDKNRWDASSPTDVTNEPTNIPSNQADSSYSENNRIGPNGLEMWITPQVDTAAFPDKPYCGAHIGARAATIVPGMVVEIDLEVKVLGGGTWSGPVCYPRTKAGENDIAEYGNTRTNKAPTANVHLFRQDANGNWFQYGQDQTAYLGNPQLAGDGKSHRYRWYYHPDGKGWSYWIDDKPSSNDKLQDPAGVPMSFWLELGVPLGEKPGTGATLICSRYEEFVAA